MLPCTILGVPIPTLNIIHLVLVLILETVAQGTDTTTTHNVTVHTPAHTGVYQGHIMHLWEAVSVC